MNPNPRLCYAIAAILSGSAGVAHAVPAEEATETASDSIAEIVVTAQRRTENIQDVPITIQALTAETLTQLNVSTFDDFIKYLPNVTQASTGPGQGSIYMRGLSQGSLGVQGEGSVGIFPNVAVYLDEQSAQLPGRNLDVYAADLERIEILEGPQGTLFGAGAEAGVVRYITNKPKLNVTEGSVDAGYGITAHGDPNNNLEAMINLPLIDDTLAVRAVVYSDRRGGYINNVPASFSRSGWDLGLALYNGGSVNGYGKVTSPGVVPADSETISNGALAGNAINPVTYQGIRLAVAWKINDVWDALLTQSYQDMDAEGVFYQMPSTGGGQYGTDSIYFGQNGTAGGTPLPPLSVSLFTPSYDKDKFENTALVVNGKIGDLKAVYAGSYLIRNVDQAQDYTNYARGKWGYYYQCTGFSKSYDPPSKCYSPASQWTDTERMSHQSQEIRLSTPDDWRFRALAGIYYEDYQINDDTEWMYRSVPECSASLDTECYLPIQPWPGAPANDPNVRNANTGFFDDITRGYKQKAAFTSLDFDLIPKTLILTAGTRYFDFTSHTAGGDVGSFYCKFYGGYVATNFGPCTTANNNGFNHDFYPGPPGFISGYHPGPYGTNVTTQAANHSSESGFRSRGNLTWKVTDDVMVYYTYSQGFRPGGFNRGTAGNLPVGFVPGQSSKCGYTDGATVYPACQFFTPLQWQSDNLTNNEIGWKTEWFAHRLQVNGAIYQEKWTNVQTEFFDPQQGLGNLTFSVNGPSYKVDGIELQFVGRVTQGLTVTGSGSWNSSEQTNSPFLLNNNPNTPGYGKPITTIPNPYGAPGSRLAQSPPFEGNLRVRYEWAINEYHAFCQVGASHIGAELSVTGNVNAFVQPGYTTYDGSMGIAKDAWTASIYGQNLTDVNTSLFTTSTQFVETQTVLRPRVLGIRFGYKFKGT
jgi:iron complex outermembrane receptor protein